MRTIQFLFIGLCLLASCSYEKKTDDPEVVKKIVAEYFDGIKYRDLSRLNSVTTADFVLFEDGKVWTNDSLINVLNRTRSFDGTWTFENIKINIDHSSADMVYFNHGELITNDTIKRTVDWVESATFRKTDGVWKMNFLHSTVRK